MSKDREQGEIASSDEEDATNGGTTKDGCVLLMIKIAINLGNNILGKY